MTALLARARRPRPFLRFSRAQMRELIVAVEKQRDLAIGETRAQRDRLATWLEQRAAAFELDALSMDRIKPRPAPVTGALTSQDRRVIAHTLRDLARDCEGQR